MLSYRMLIVDDEAATLKMLYTYFTELGYEVSTASNSAEAHERFSLQLDVMIIAKDLPDTDAYRLWDELHGNSTQVTIPALFITTQEPPPFMGEILYAPLYDEIVEPFDIEEMRLRVKRLIEIREQYLKQ